MKRERITSRQLTNKIESGNNQLFALYSIGIENLIVRDKLLIETDLGVHFTNCIFCKEVVFSSRNIKNSTRFFNCWFINDLHVLDSSSDSGFIILSCKFSKDVIINNFKAPEFILQGNFYQKVRCSGSDIEKWTIGGRDKSYFKHLYFSNDKSTGKCNIFNCDFDDLHLNSMTITSEIEMYNCNFSSIVLHKIRNSGAFKVVNCSSVHKSSLRTYFSIDRCNLGKAEFIQVQFSAFDEFNIVDSVLIDCLFINVSWGNNINTFAGGSMDNFNTDRSKKNAAVHLSKKRDVFKQIKYALSKQGDVVNEQMFHGKEMDVLRKILPRTKSSTLLILTLSKLTSNYGQSLIRPICTIIVVNGVLFIALVYSRQIPGLIFSGSFNISMNDILVSIAKFIQFINPLHRNEPELLGLFFIIDALMRVVSSYSIYNLIRATRRFIK